MYPANPFITHGYLDGKHFCDRVEETARLTQLLTNGNNVVMMSPRRMGKTGLISHCFAQAAIKNDYYTFLVDIYATKNMQELVYELGRNILDTLKPRGRKAWEKFLGYIGSLRSGITFDINGNPEWNVGLGEISVPTTTLDEIFSYLESADRKCIVAIDEFQAVAQYPEGNAEAVLRTRIQHCQNSWFIFAGSQRHLMAEMFSSPARPFYQSTSMMTIKAIDLDKYISFAQTLFREHHKEKTPETVVDVYQRYDGITWYVQSVLNALFAMTDREETCQVQEVGAAVRQVIESHSYGYASLLYQLPTKQKEVLIAISREGKATNITSKPFLQRHKLTASSIQAAVKGLLEKDFITLDLGIYSPYDLFFAQWLIAEQGKDAVGKVAIVR